MQKCDEYRSQIVIDYFVALRDGDLQAIADILEMAQKDARLAHAIQHVSRMLDTDDFVWIVEILVLAESQGTLSDALWSISDMQNVIDIDSIAKSLAVVQAGQMWVEGMQKMISALHELSEIIEPLSALEEKALNSIGEILRKLKYAVDGNPDGQREE